MAAAASLCATLIFLAAFAMPPASAQQPEIDALAAKLAKALSDAHAKKVVVFDFTGPGKGVTQLGVSLAGQFSTALSHAGNDYSLIDRSELMAALQKEKLDSSNPWDSPSLGVARWIAGEAGASALVVGELAEDPNGTRITVDSYQVSQGARIGGFGTTIPRNSALSKLEAETFQDPSATVSRADAKGYLPPECLHCPVPGLPPDALRMKQEGTVVLRGVVSAGGTTGELRVLKDPGYDLAKLAIKAVQEWRLSPATGPDGKPAAVQTLMEVTFRLLHGPGASLREAELTALAAKLAKALSDIHATKVAIFDFTGPGKGVSGLGTSLAYQLALDLARVAQNYTLLNRENLIAVFHKENMDPYNPWDSQSLGAARWIAGDAGASTVVVGTLANDPKGIRLTIDACPVSTENRIKRLSVTLPAAATLDDLSTEEIRTTSMNFPEGGKGGYGVPKCVSCPVPRFTESPVAANKVQSTVVLSVVITADGEASAIRVVQDPGLGLAEAIQAVSKWRFVPATGLDGKPAPVRVQIQVISTSL